MCRTLIAWTVLAAVAGCSKETPVYPVTGTVKLADGTPAVGCVVEFTSEAEGTNGTNASGEVQADGTYKLTSNINGKLQEGAVAGSHKVIVVPPPPGSGGPPPLPVVPRYADYKQSGLTFDVKPGESNTYPITLEAK